MARLYPSLIAANPLYLHQTIQKLEPYCSGFHCDIMDNHFVPNLTFGPDIVNAIDAATSHPSWVHLMVDDPLAWCKTLSLKTNSIVSFHIETTKEINTMIKCIKENNWKASIAIKPKMAIAEIFPYLSLIDQVLIMSVEPGFSGQQFLESTLTKIAPLIAERTKRNLSLSIGIDGGISADNISSIAKQGVDDFAIGSAIFAQPDPVAALQTLSALVKKR